MHLGNPADPPRTITVTTNAMTPRFAPERIEQWPLDRLNPYARNARTHDDDQIAQIAASIAEFGWMQPLLVDDAGNVIAGHGRLLAARKLGLDTVPVIRASHLTPAQVQAYRLVDNRLAELSGWNDELLAGELHALNGEGFELSLLGFDEAELDRLMAPLDDDADTPGHGDTGSPAGENGADAADEVPEPAKETVTRPGDLWRLGEHRLLCGDSTEGDCVARVMDGERAALLFTSPPYANQRTYTTGGIGDWHGLMTGVFRHLDMAMREDGQVLVNLGLIHRDNEVVIYWRDWCEWMRAQGWRRFALYAWDQREGLPGSWNGRLAPSFELIHHFNRVARTPHKIIRCKWVGHVNDSHGGIRHRDGHVGEWSHAGRPVQPFKIPDSVIRVTRHKSRGIECEHPAIFPWRLPAFVMESYSDPNEISFDPFAGSGTSIIAGERTNRRVRAIELADTYTDLAVRRWRQLFPELPVTLDGSGKDFGEVAAERGIEIASAA